MQNFCERVIAVENMKKAKNDCFSCTFNKTFSMQYPCNECVGFNKWEDASKTKLVSASKTDDPVNHPSHYTKGKIEVADFISDQKLNFNRGNAVKYVCRAGSKDPNKEVQDLEKAIWYIEHEINVLKGESENA